LLHKMKRPQHGKEEERGKTKKPRIHDEEMDDQDKKTTTKDVEGGSKRGTLETTQDLRKRRQVEMTYSNEGI